MHFPANESFHEQRSNRHQFLTPARNYTTINILHHNIDFPKKRYASDLGAVSSEPVGQFGPTGIPGLSFRVRKRAQLGFAKESFIRVTLRVFQLFMEDNIIIKIGDGKTPCGNAGQPCRSFRAAIFRVSFLSSSSPPSPPPPATWSSLLVPPDVGARLKPLHVTRHGDIKRHAGLPAEVLLCFVDRPQLRLRDQS